MAFAKLELLRLNEQLLENIKQAKAAGSSEEQLREELRKVEEGLERLYREDA